MKIAIALVLAAVGAAAVLFALDRALLRAEERGWIYYRKKRGHVDRLGDAAFRVQALLEPGKQHIVEEKDRVKREGHDDAAPPEPP